jgi:hypothetical protein
VFSTAHIALTALITAVVGWLVLLPVRSRAKALSMVECGALALVAGFAVLAWRLAGNAPQLNADPIPAVSPADLLSPVVAYVLVGIYAGIRGLRPQTHWELARGLLAIVAFVVNVVTI